MNESIPSTSSILGKLRNNDALLSVTMGGKGKRTWLMREKTEEGTKKKSSEKIKPEKRRSFVR
jgi:hypothetical protein